MKNLTQILTGILIVQLGLIGWSFANKPTLESFTPEEPLLNLSSLNSLSEIRIIPSSTEDANDAATLKKVNDKWLLANHFDFPVSEQKLKLIEEELFAVKKPYPSGTSALAAKQFFVSDDNFKLKVEFLSSAEKPLETVYFGSSPTFKKVYARVANSDLTYAVPFSVFSLKGKPSSWIDRELLKIDQGQVEKINFKDFTLSQDPQHNDLVISDLAETETEDKTAVSELVKAALAPGFLEVLGTEDKKEYGQAEPIYTYTIDLKDGKSRVVSIGKLEGQDNYFTLKVNEFPYFFKSSSFQTDKIVKVERSNLVKIKENKEETNKDGETPQTSTNDSTVQNYSTVQNDAAEQAK